MTPRRFLPALLLLFVGSGCAALIYEVVWFQLLQLVIGSSAVSMGVLLGTFMGGMCLGSFLLPRFVGREPSPAARLRVSRARHRGLRPDHPVRDAAAEQSSTSPFRAAPASPGIVMRGVAAAIILLPPTLLMGATLPAMSRWVESTPEGVSWLGFFYGGNIGGGVLGCLLAGFYLLRVYDLVVATFVAIALNVAVALIGLAIAKAAPAVGAARRRTATRTRRKPVAGAWAIYVAIALSGATALSSEVIWTRLLSLLFGGTVYTFSLILAVFLLGLGIGSSAGLGDRPRLARIPRVLFGWCQMFAVRRHRVVRLHAHAVDAVLADQPVDHAPTCGSTSSSISSAACGSCCPGPILWGASFPLALASLASRGQDPARLVGGVYAANTVGAIVGSLGASLLLGRLARQPAHHAGADPAVGALRAARPLDRRQRGAGGRRGSQFAGTVTIIVAAAIAGLLSRTVQPIPGIFAAYGRYTATRVGQADVIYMGEGWNATVAVTRLPGGVLNYHNAGKVQASSEPQDMRLQRMLGHLTTLIPKQAKKVVVIGCGAGVTAGAVSIDPAVEHQTIAEIEPLVPQVVVEAIRRAQLPRRRQPEGPHPDRRRAALPADDGREVRRDHVGPARPVGQGRRDALHATSSSSS